VDEENDPQTAIQSGRTPIGSKLYYFRNGRPLLLKTRVIATGEILPVRHQVLILKMQRQWLILP
jgi:hypothetical protein